jgi:plastocyanin
MDSRGPARRTLAIGVAVIVLVGLFTVGTSQATMHTSAVKQVTGSALPVTASKGFAFSPDLISNTPVNTSVTVTFTDGDTLSHSFTISSREGWVIPSSYQAGDLAAFFTHYPPLFSLLVNNSGQQVVANFTSPPVGWYEFVCNQSGHFEQGMYGFIAYGENLPSNLTVSALSTAPGAAVFIISGTIVALVVVAIVLGFVVGRRRGTRHEMPPVRLGYPEPSAPVEPAAPPGRPRAPPG